MMTMMMIAVPAVLVPNVDDGIVHMETWLSKEMRSGRRNNRAGAYERGCTNSRD